MILPRPCIASHMLIDIFGRGLPRLLFGVKHSGVGSCAPLGNGSEGCTMADQILHRLQYLKVRGPHYDDNYQYSLDAKELQHVQGDEARAAKRSQVDSDNMFPAILEQL